MLDYAKDEQATREGCFYDPRSYIDNLGHEHLRGKDRSFQRRKLFRAVGGSCADCGRVLSEEQGDMDHLGRTPKTRCDCFNRKLNDGTVCTGIAWRCTLDPRKGGNPNSCHGKRHGRIIGGKKHVDEFTAT